MRVIKQIILVFSILLGFSYAFEIKNLAQAVNEAGRQRMLTQRMLKDYAMIGMNNTFGNPKEDLKSVIKTFQEHLDALSKFATDADTKKSLEEERNLWKEVKKYLNETPTKDKVIELEGKLDKLLKVADKTTKFFSKQTGKESGEIINISGRQRMLSQRIAGLYMIKVWGINDPEFKYKLKRAVKLYSDSLDILMESDINTPEIKKILLKLKKEMMFFNILNSSNSMFVPSLIYKKSNEILKSMNLVTELYTKQKVR